MRCDRCQTFIPKKMNQCPSCGHWQFRGEAASDDDALIPLSEVDESALETRYQTGRWDRVWGGSVEPGISRIGVFFVGGYPGSGKSTLSLQTLAPIVEVEERPALYLGNEQGGAEIKKMARRIGMKRFDLVYVPKIRGGITYPLSDGVLSCNPCCIIQDSLPGNEGASLVESASILSGLKDIADTECPVIVVNHVNSEGEMAGWMQLEHLVTGVYMLEPTHRRDDPWRRFRAMKNRMGRTESMILEMGDKGLFAHPDACPCRVCKKEGKR
jgi:predicted ATP-dependent serine protease